MPSVLAIGNSFSENATAYLEDLMAARPGSGLTLGKVSIGGCSLEKHWNLVEQCELLPHVKPYMLSLSGDEPRPVSLVDALTAQRWDVVTLQQVSDQSWRLETYFPYIERLYELIGRLAPQARVVIHQTWAYRSDGPSLLKWGIDQGEMYARLQDAYQTVASQFSCPVIPSGLAFQKARAILGYVPDPDYDFENPPLMVLPNQEKSLIVGYYWRTGNTPSGKAELGMDERHGNAKGRYLANAVWYELFTGQPISQNPFCPREISRDDLEILQTAAHEAVIQATGW